MRTVSSTAPSTRSALAGLPAALAPGAIQFFDGYFPALAANSYQIAVTHAVSGDGESPSYSRQQEFVVEAPEFVIDQNVVQSCYPPDGSTGIYDQNLPFIVLSDPSLPWERSLVPDDDEPDPANPRPWMALLLFAEGEIRLQTGSNNPVATATVQQLVAADPDVLKPTFPAGWLSAATLASQCQTITVTGAAFAAIAPQTDDLTYLAHCRAVRSPQEGEALLSVLLSNRLAVADSRGTSPAPLRYYAHLVSLEGFADYLGAAGKPIPSNSHGDGLMDVQLASLASWTFVSLPEPGMSFAQLVQGLIDSEQATPTLNLPVTAGSGAEPVVLDRLRQGYAPLAFVTGAGQQSFAWYRGPFSPVVPQPLPPVGNPPSDIRHATTADALMIYLAEQGLFDLSYAAAWNIGRGLALADSRFAQTVNLFRQSGNAALARLSQRLAMPHFAGQADLGRLAAPQATSAHFSQRIGAGLGKAWTQALASVRDGARPGAPQAYRAVAPSRRCAVPPRQALAMPGAAAAVTESVQDILDSIAAWLANLSLLRPIPFSHLVPDPRMLPAESIRFFYVDQGWIDAAVAGALSIAVHGSADLALLATCRPELTQGIAAHLAGLSAGATGMSATGAGGTGVTGMLIRSQLVSGWPDLVVGPSLGGAPLPVIRDDRPSPAVRLSLFQGVPDAVTLSEPYQGLQFGVEDSGVYPRCVTQPGVAGAQLTNAAPVDPAPFLRAPAAGAIGGVVEIASLAAALEPAAGVMPFAGDAVVQWNGTALATTGADGRQLSAAVPAALVAAPGQAAVTVVTGGVASAPVTFTIDPPLAIDSLFPAVAEAGGGGFTLAVQGVGFGSDAVVSWNGTPLVTSVVSAMEVDAAVPASLIAAIGTATIIVTTGGSTSGGATFSVIGGEPAIESLLPNVQPAGGSGFTLTVTGSAFGSDSKVQWNGSALPTRVAADGSLAASVPAGLLASAGTAAVTVTSGGLSSAPASFTIAGPDPTIGRIAPTIALAGGGSFTLVVDGVNFGTAAAIGWNGTALATTFDDSEQLTATVPASAVAAAGEATITVASGGTTSNAMALTIIAPQPAIGLLEPDRAVAGSAAFTLKVTTGFGSAAYALQVVRAPESQSFIPINPARTGGPNE